MKPRDFLITITGLINAVLLLAGCATAGRNALPQGGGMTMSDIYKQETQETGLTGSFYPSNDPALEKTKKKKQRLMKLTRDYYAQNKPVNQLFRQLPNPEIPMYVYPHLAGENGDAEPVPGYTTAFFLYKQNHFAMPSEDYAGQK